MTEQSRDRLEGAFDEAKGRGKEALGKLADDKSTEMEGRRDQAEGQAKKGLADVKDATDDMVKDVTDREGR
jgi:uncharacterized protein YjbJ (UPF0337 family)